MIFGAAKIAKRDNPIQRLSPSPDEGLTAEEALYRLKNGAANKAGSDGSESVANIIVSNVFTYFNAIFAVLAVMLAAVGAYRGLTFAPIIVANTLIGIIQQIRSKRTLDKLRMMNARSARVVRDGKIVTVAPEETVLDDVAVLCAGNQVYADMIILKGNVKVNESLLTGESDEITRSAGDTLMSGSFIVSGECRARLDKVGDNSYISRLSAQAKKTDKREHSEIMRSLNKIIKIVGVIIIPVGIIMLWEQYCLNGNSAYDAVSAVVAALLGMIPEGLYLLTSTALALSVMRLAGKKVNVHDMSCVETLAEVDVLCVDKTGTITENTMKVKEVVNLTDDMSAECLNAVIGCFCASMTSDNITMKAMKEYFDGYASETAKRTVPFSARNKYSAAVIGENSYVLGAPEIVLRGDYCSYRGIAEEYGKKGFRVLAFAEYAGSDFSGVLTEKAHALGFVLLRNPVRAHAARTFEYFTRQGVEIKVISGDNPITASEAAKEAKIPNAGNYMDCSALKSEDEIYEAVKDYTVFGRVTPEMKRSMIKALRKQGRTAAMTGDGVNDVPALKEADCSVAMASGSEAAANVSQIVLMESDFSKLPNVLLEGRRVVNNIERSAGLFLIKNIFSFLLALASMIAVFNYPLQPAQITLINAFTIGGPGFLLSLENNKNLIKGSFIKNVLKKALPAALTDFLTVFALVAYCGVKGYNDTEISTITVYVVSAVGFFVLLGIARPYNLFRIAVLAVMAVGFTVSVICFEGFFALESLNMRLILTAAAFAAGAAVLLFALTRVFKRLFMPERKNNA